MKTRKLFVAAVLGLGLMTACTNDDAPQQVIDDNNGEQTLTQLALTVATEASTRTVSGNTGDAEYGDDNEYTVSSLMVVFANAEGIAQQVYNPKMLTASDTDEDDKRIRVTEPFKVTPGSYYIYVLANYNSGAISPVIAGQTDMKQVFEIVNASALSTASQFLMCNAAEPTETAIATASATDDKVNDAGESDGSSEKVQLIQVEIERVVAKVTFTQSTKAFEVKDANNTSVKIADATVDGVGIINLNKKMNLVKNSQMATNKPAANWVYPKDPNYDTVLNGSNDSYVTENFTQTEVTTWSDDFTAAKFYCPENTMTAAAQQNGQTTGVVYRVKWEPNTTDNAGYTTLDKDASDNYSQKFAAVLGYASKDASITDNIFTTVPADANGTFYTYGNLIFVSKNAACLYKAIAEDTSADDVMAANINTAYKALIAKGAADLENDNIKEYANGYAYYPVWIKHNPSSTTAMEQDKYGVVRNHWYDLTVTGIKALGNNEPTYEDPEDPDDPEEVNIQVEATIKKWTIVKQDVVLE